MKPKHLRARISYCLAIAECSTCPRRKFGAVLFDPAHNVDVTAGYNGPPRGAEGDLCGPRGHFCVRDGLCEDDVRITDMSGKDATGDVGVEDNDACLFVKGRRTSFDVQGQVEHFQVLNSWIEEVKAARDKLLTKYPPIQSGTQLHLGCHHAESNAITNAARLGIKTDGCHLVVTGEPCLACAKLIHHAGIAKVYCIQGGYVGGDAGPEYLRTHGIEVEYVAGPRDPRSL
jgi:deoxycytidylate deaminase